jgi:hypothetical protein
MILSVHGVGQPGRKSKLVNDLSGRIVYHVLNRANGRLGLFKKDEDFLAFEKVMYASSARILWRRC